MQRLQMELNELLQTGDRKLRVRMALRCLLEVKSMTHGALVLGGLQKEVHQEQIRGNGHDMTCRKPNLSEKLWNENKETKHDRLLRKPPPDTYDTTP